MKKIDTLDERKQKLQNEITKPEVLTLNLK